uniref:JmjC domain-containing protein n=1 Tax=Panagrolaimus sp. ES5 TaxID=591445 RepID=A0AC34G322_9BILA
MDKNLDEVPIIQVKLPDEFMKLFVLEPKIVKYSLTPEQIGPAPVLSRKEFEGVSGLYRSSNKYPKENTKVDKVLEILKKMKITENGNWRDHFTRETLQQNSSVEYITHCDYSYMQKIWDKYEDLPRGWNINTCPNLLRQLYGSTQLNGLTTSSTIIGDLDTGSVLHQDDFGLCTASLSFPGSADKYWFGFLPKYAPRLYEIINVIPNYRSCILPISHRDLLVDIELIEELNFPYWIAEQKPGYMTFIGPSVVHQVRNAGANWNEAINFISYRWDVEAHRQPFTCCDRDKDFFDKPEWDPLKSYFLESENEMKREWNKFKLVEKEDIGEMIVEDDLHQNSQEHESNDGDNEKETEKEKELNEPSMPSSDLKSKECYQTKFQDEQNEESSNPESVEELSDEEIFDKKETLLKEKTISEEEEEQTSSEDESCDEENVFKKNITIPSCASSEKNDESENEQEFEKEQNIKISTTITTSEEPLPINLKERVPASKEIKPKLDQINKRIRANYLKRQATATKEYELKRPPRKALKTPVPKYQRKISNAIQHSKDETKAAKIIFERTSKANIAKEIDEMKEDVSKKVMKILVTHSNRIKKLSPNGYKIYRNKLEEKINLHGTKIEQLERQQDLLKGLEKSFGVEYVKKKDLQGYVTYEIARDYINGQKSDDRILFVKALELANCKHFVFWEEALSTKEKWNETFGIVEKEGYRIPAHSY